MGYSNFINPQPTSCQGTGKFHRGIPKEEDVFYSRTFHHHGRRNMLTRNSKQRIKNAGNSRGGGIACTPVPSPSGEHPPQGSGLEYRPEEGRGGGGVNSG